MFNLVYQSNNNNANLIQRRIQLYRMTE